MNLISHLEHLDHGHIADLVGDARIIDLIRSLDKSAEDLEKGRIVLDALGGVAGILDDPERRRRLFITLSRTDEQQLREYLSVKNVYRMRLTPKRRKHLFSFFGYEPPAVDQTESSPLAEPATVDYGLFPHQSRALLACDRIISKPGGRTMLHMPTGSGKTRTAMHLICRHLNNNERSLVVWLVSGLELCEQAATEFQSAWRFLGERPLPVIRLWGGKRTVDLETFKEVEKRSLRSLKGHRFEDDRWPADLGDGLIVASLESLLEVIDTWEPRDIVARAAAVGLVVFDEAHRAVATTFRRVLEIVAGKSSVLGLSATPGRRHHGEGSEEDAELVALFGRRKVVLTIPEYDSPVEGLIAQGYLSHLNKEQLEVANESMPRADIARLRERLSRDLDVDEEMLTSFGLDATRNLQIVERVERLSQEGHERILLFAPSVFSAQLIANIINSRGMWARCVTAETSLISRENILEEFKNDESEAKVITNFGVLTTGFDAPRISAVVIARPTNSIVLLSQMAGRATRGPKVGGTTEASLVTVVDTGVPELTSTIQQFHAFDDAWKTREE